MAKQVFIVELHGIEDSTCLSLSQALQYIGTRILGKRTGCLLVTVQQALEAGYKIRPCTL